MVTNPTIKENGKRRKDSSLHKRSKYTGPVTTEEERSPDAVLLIV